MNLIIIPKDGASDETVKIISLYKSNGSYVKKNEEILEYETSKASVDLLSDFDGYISYFYEKDKTIRIGEPVCMITSKPIHDSELNQKKVELGLPTEIQTSDKLVSKKAQRLIKENNIQIENFSEDVITEKIVTNYLGLTSKPKKEEIHHKSFKNNDIVIYGIGGHAGMCIDIIKNSSEYNLIGFVDDNVKKDNRYGLQYFGDFDEFDRLFKKGLKNIIIGIGFLHNLKKRERIYNKLKIKFNIPSFIHHSAIIEDTANVEEGCQIMAGSIIGSNVNIAENSIINSGSIISHDTDIGSSSHITPGATIAGNVKIGKRVTIGMCATIYINSQIKDDVVIKNNENFING